VTRQPIHIPDAEGRDLRPDPSQAQTAFQFMDCLRTYRLWCGAPSFRKMAIRCRHAKTASPLREALVADDLPKLDVLQAILEGLEAPPRDRELFIQAWQRLSLAADLTGGRP